MGRPKKVVGRPTFFFGRPPKNALLIAKAPSQDGLAAFETSFGAEHLTANKFFNSYVTSQICDWGKLTENNSSVMSQKTFYTCKHLFTRSKKFLHV